MRSSPPAAPKSTARSHTKQSPEYGSGVQTLELSEFELADAQQLRHKLLSIFRSPDYKPPVLPNIALELTELSRKAHVSYDDVTRVVEKDPMIVASVLKLAQSPLYGGRTPVQSLKDALNRLGINMLRDLVWQVVVGMRLFRVRNYTATMERLQLHATFTAHAARIVAARAGIAAEHAFLCGLLHDIGWCGTLIAISEGVKKPPEPETLFAAIDKMHMEAGAAMAKLWGLSPEIVSVVGHHHDFSKDKPAVSALVPVLCVAERLGDEMAFAVEEAEEDGSLRKDRIDANLDGRFEHALQLLRLESKLDGIRNMVGEAAERIRSGAQSG
ncbi:MAG: HDOD domain-containing protein [Polyangiales bacterium]